METLKRYRACGTSTKLYFTFTLDPYFAPNWYAEAVTGASGFTQLNSGGSLYGYVVEIGAAEIVHEIEIRAREGDGGDWTHFILEFDLTLPCTTEQEVCCTDESVTIRWLGREGGIKQWTFTGVKTFDVRVGDANKFKNNNLQAQYSQRSNIYYGKVITSGSISKVQSDFLDELKYSIQAWEVDGTTVLPILINNESFDKYKSTQKFYDTSLAYIAAEEVRIQTQ